MRLVFDDMNKQMMYISRFVSQFTNLEKKCQICGKPTTITHNPVDPYKIQLICSNCRKEHSYNIKGIIEIPATIPTVIVPKITSPILPSQLLIKEKNFDVM